MALAEIRELLLNARDDVDWFGGQVVDVVPADALFLEEGLRVMLRNGQILHVSVNVLRRHAG